MPIDTALKTPTDLKSNATKSVAEAQAIIANRPKATAEDRRLSAFIGTFARMALSEKKGALAQLAGMLPAGFSLVEEN